MKVTVPTSLSDIKLSQYQKFIRTTKDSKDDNFVARQMVGIFCNLTDEQVKNIAANSFDDLVNSITSVLIKEPKFKSTFNLDGVDYGFIPNLDEITLGEKVDLDSYYQDLETMDKAMAVLYRPIKIKKRDKYLIEAYTGDSNSIDPTLDIVFGANFFFLNLMNELLNYIPNFIETGSGAQSESIADFGTKWGWYSSLYQLAQGDVRRFEEITELKLFSCLTYLSFEADKNKMESDLIKKRK